MASTFMHENSGIDHKSLKTPDRFLSALNHGVFSLFQHKGAVIGIILVFVLAGVAGAFWMNRATHLSVEANNAFYKAEKSLEIDIQNLIKKEAPSQSVDKAQEKGKAPSRQEEGAVEFKKLDVASVYAQSLPLLKSVSEKYPKTRAGFEATLQVGNLYFKHGDSVQAQVWFEKASHGAQKAMDKAIAYSSLGYTLENQGKMKEAITAFQKALTQGEPSLKGDLMLAMARCYENLQDVAKARGVYDQISVELPKSEYSKVAEQRKNRL